MKTARPHLLSSAGRTTRRWIWRRTGPRGRRCHICLQNHRKGSVAASFPTSLSLSAKIESSIFLTQLFFVLSSDVYIFLCSVGDYLTAMSSSSATDTTHAPPRELDLESKAEDIPGNESSDNAVDQKSQAATYQFLEGGMKAWLVVLGCWYTSFATFGYVNSFG